MCNLDCVHQMHPHHHHHNQANILSDGYDKHPIRSLCQARTRKSTYCTINTTPETPQNRYALNPEECQKDCLDIKRIRQVTVGYVAKSGPTFFVSCGGEGTCESTSTSSIVKSGRLTCIYLL